MARPRTKAAEYEPYAARISKDVMRGLRANAERLGCPINTELNRVLRHALHLNSPEEDRDYLALHPSPVRA